MEEVVLKVKKVFWQLEQWGSFERDEEEISYSVLMPGVAWLPGALILPEGRIFTAEFENVEADTVDCDFGAFADMGKMYWKSKALAGVAHQRTLDIEYEAKAS